jgi:hypothetical protein
MAPEQLRELLRRTPFRPFRLYTSGGQSYDVPGPEWMMVTNRTTALGVPGRSDDGDVVILIDNLHVTHTIPLTIEQPPA